MRASGLIASARVNLHVEVIGEHCIVTRSIRLSCRSSPRDNSGTAAEDAKAMAGHTELVSKPKEHGTGRPLVAPAASNASC